MSISLALSGISDNHAKGQIMNLGSLIRLWVGLGADALAYQALIGWDGALIVLLVLVATFRGSAKSQSDRTD